MRMEKPPTHTAWRPSSENVESTEEAEVVKTRFALMFAFAVLVLGLASPAFAQESGTPAAAANVELVRWSIITAGFALAIAAAFGALSQAKGLSAAVEGIARNPAAANDIRGNLILGLVLIESLVIYVLLVSLILFFVKPFGG
jgi:F-type H+-transporting ATPase subunit c